MVIPLTFDDLTPEEHAWICNGCGPVWFKVPEFIFREACCRHDFDYWSGFTANDRARADRRFLARMREAIKASAANPWQRWAWWFVAQRYYWAVKLFGRRSFRFDRRCYGTRDDLIREMQGGTTTPEPA